MELFYSPLACSLAARIACLEARIPVTPRRADLGTKRAEGREGGLLSVNPMGKVPVLVCDDGLVLTENVAVLLFLGDRAPQSGLTPPEGTPARYEVVKWLSFVATELHKRVHANVFAPDPRRPDAVKQYAQEGAAQPLAVLEAHLRGRTTLAGHGFTVADAYLVWALFLLSLARSGVPLDPYPDVRAYLERHLQRDSVRVALSTESEEYKQPGWTVADPTRGLRPAEVKSAT
jgi:glutathione S-transferase